MLLPMKGREHDLLSPWHHFKLQKLLKLLAKKRLILQIKLYKIFDPKGIGQGLNHRQIQIQTMALPAISRVVNDVKTRNGRFAVNGENFILIIRIRLGTFMETVIIIGICCRFFIFCYLEFYRAFVLFCGVVHDPELSKAVYNQGKTQLLVYLEIKETLLHF